MSSTMNSIAAPHGQTPGNGHFDPEKGWTAAQLQALRAQFPILAETIHGHPLAYLDNAASSPMPLSVLQAMQEFEQHQRANIHRGVHSLSQRATDAFEQARATLKNYLGAGPEHELVFTSGTTEALNQVAYGLWGAGPEQAWLRPGDDIIVSGLEHHANLVPWQHAARISGARLRILQPDAQGQLHLDDLAALLATGRPRVLALTACANATGECPPYAAMLSLARQAGALTVLDAAQVAAHGLPRLQALECDFLALSGHKMHGPMGIGLLAGRRQALEQLYPLRLGGDMVEHVSYQQARYAGLPARPKAARPTSPPPWGWRRPRASSRPRATPPSTPMCARCAPRPCRGCRRLPACAYSAHRPAQRRWSASAAKASTRMTSARCSTNAASPCEPATIAPSRCWNTWAWGRPPGPHSPSTTAPKKSSACAPP